MHEDIGNGGQHVGEFRGALEVLDEGVESEEAECTLD